MTKFRTKDSHYGTDDDGEDDDVEECDWCCCCCCRRLTFVKLLNSYVTTVLGCMVNDEKGKKNENYTSTLDNVYIKGGKHQFVFHLIVFLLADAKYQDVLCQQWWI